MTTKEAIQEMEREAIQEMESIINAVEDLVESGYYTLEEVTDNIRDTLCHLTPE